MVPIILYEKTVFELCTLFEFAFLNDSFQYNV